MTPEGVLKRLKSVAPVLAGALLILAIVALRGYPAVFTDTDNYYKQGRGIALSAGRLFNPAPNIAPGAIDPRVEAARKLREGYAYTSMGARSPFYGVFLYVLRGIGTLWLLTLVQALAAAWMVRLLWRTAAAGSPAWTYYGLMAALAGFTSLPFVAAFAVPDIFAAAGAIAAVLLIVYRQRLSRAEQIGVGLLLFFSLVIHSSHMLTAAVLVAVAAALLCLLKVERRSIAISVSLVIGAIIAANLANGLYSAGIKASTGHTLRRPPFLMARVLADGPGRDWLQIACARGEPLQLCRFKDQKLDVSDDILWSNVKGVGVFNLSTPPQRIRMEEQELDFVIAAVAHQPLRQIGASLRNWGQQMAAVHLDDPLKDPIVYLRHSYWKNTFIAEMLREVGPCTARGGCRPRIHWRDLAALHRGVILLTLGFLAFRLTRDDVIALIRRRDWKDEQTRTLAALTLLLAAIAINAAVCGVLSGVFARYQTRVAWMIPLVAGLAALAVAPASAWKRETWERAVASVLGVEVSPAFVRFAMVGIVGFAVDAIILHALVWGAGFNQFGARLISFPAAVLATWWLNRTFTFQTSGEAGKSREAAVYFGVQGAGGVANLAVYGLAMLIVPALRTYLLIPLVLGSAAGLCVTYLGSKHLAFRRAIVDTPPVDPAEG